MKCTTCDDTYHVCENHPHLPWDGLSDSDAACGCGAGMPCPECCDDSFVPVKRKERRGDDRSMQRTPGTRSWVPVV